MAPPLAALVGPTASGKTDLSLAMAERLNAEILVADSRQVFRGLDEGTAKVEAAARARIPHHLLDLVEPDQPFTVAQWAEQARAFVSQIAARGRLPFVVGGTGLYVSALVDGYDFAAQPWSPEVRERLADELEAEGLAVLAERLARLDPASAARTDLRNPRRVLRALERAELVGESAAGTVGAAPYAGRLALVGLSRPLAVLDRRIDQRAEAMFAGGLLDETRAAPGARPGPVAPGHDRSRLRRGRRLPGGGVDPRGGHRHHRATRPPIRPPPAQLVPARQAHRVDRRRRSPGRRPRPRPAGERHRDPAGARVSTLD